MVFYKHGNLYDLITKKSNLKIAAQKWTSLFMHAIIFDIAKGLEEMHSRQIYHDDMKVTPYLLHVTLLTI
jgi:serine/threonine protein kinase